GTLYVADLLNTTASTTFPVSTSFDRGNTFARIREVAPDAVGLTWDREWLAAEGSGHVVATARATNLYAAWVSRDSADTFSGPFTIADDVIKGGRPVFAPDGTVYAPYSTTTETRIARSDDGGQTWSTFKIADAP